MVSELTGQLFQGSTYLWPGTPACHHGPGPTGGRAESYVWANARAFGDANGFPSNAPKRGFLKQAPAIVRLPNAALDAAVTRNAE